MSACARTVTVICQAGAVQRRPGSPCTLPVNRALNEMVFLVHARLPTAVHSILLHIGSRPYCQTGDTLQKLPVEKDAAGNSDGASCVHGRNHHSRPLWHALARNYVWRCSCLQQPLFCANTCQEARTWFVGMETALHSLIRFRSC
eukprot:949359-Pelagomonas_calceolata.AAC.3